MRAARTQMSGQTHTLVAKVTEYNGNLICDTCGRLSARGSEEAQAFQVITWQDGEAVHVCGHCVSQLNAGLLAENASTLDCARCGRDERSGEDQWHKVEDYAGRRITYCADCWVELGDLGGPWVRCAWADVGGRCDRTALRSEAERPIRQHGSRRGAYFDFPVIDGTRWLALEGKAQSVAEVYCSNIGDGRKLLAHSSYGTGLHKDLRKHAYLQAY